MEQGLHRELVAVFSVKVLLVLRTLTERRLPGNEKTDSWGWLTHSGAFAMVALLLTPAVVVVLVMEFNG